MIAWLLLAYFAAIDHTLYVFDSYVVYHIIAIACDHNVLLNDLELCLR